MYGVTRERCSREVAKERIYSFRWREAEHSSPSKVYTASLVHDEGRNSRSCTVWKAAVMDSPNEEATR